MPKDNQSFQALGQLLESSCVGEVSQSSPKTIVVDSFELTDDNQGLYQGQENFTVVFSLNSETGKVSVNVTNSAGTLARQIYAADSLLAMLVQAFCKASSSTWSADDSWLLDCLCS